MGNGILYISKLKYLANCSQHESSNPDVKCVRYTKILGTGPQLEQRRRQKRPTNPLLPLRPNRHPKRNDGQGRQFTVVRQLHRLEPSERGNQGNG